ncbi:MAG: hypothetical protein ACYC96_16715 [Fimbriimonadaceae bacterium]
MHTHQEEHQMATKTTGFTGELRRPDAQGRIVIGKEHADETYAVEKQPSGDILLRPVVVMHKREAWLFANQDALASVKRGLEQAATGAKHDLGSFAGDTDDDCEED